MTKDTVHQPLPLVNTHTALSSVGKPKCSALAHNDNIRGGTYT